jgi:DNA mismatch repair protein MSH4
MSYRHNSIYADIATTLVQFPDLDKMLNGLCNVPKSMTTNTVRTSIDTLIYIKHAISVARSVGEILAKLQQIILSDQTDSSIDTDNAAHLIQQLLDNLMNDGLNQLYDHINELLTEQSSYSKSSQEMRFQECFAIKTGINGLLDVARKSYLQAIEEMQEVIKLNKF